MHIQLYYRTSCPHSMRLIEIIDTQFHYINKHISYICLDHIDYNIQLHKRFIIHPKKNIPYYIPNCIQYTPTLYIKDNHIIEGTHNIIEYISKYYKKNIVIFSNKDLKT